MMRKTMVTVLAVLIGTVGGLTTCTGLQSANSSVQTVVVATSPNYPPMEYIDKLGNLVGLDIDIMEAVARAAGFAVEFVHVPFGELSQGLRDRNYDAVISGATIHGREDAGYEFSIPYFWCDQVLVVDTAAWPATTPGDLTGATVGVWGIAEDGAGVGAADSDYQFTTVPLGGYTTMLPALLDGEVDAILVDFIYAHLITREAQYRGRLGFVAEPLGSDPFGVMVAAGNAELLDLINAGLSQIIATGEVDSLIEEWFR